MIRAANGEVLHQFQIGQTETERWGGWLFFPEYYHHVPDADIQLLPEFGSWVISDTGSGWLRSNVLAYSASLLFGLQILDRLERLGWAATPENVERLVGLYLSGNRPRDTHLHSWMQHFVDRAVASVASKTC